VAGVSGGAAVPDGGPGAARLGLEPSAEALPASGTTHCCFIVTV